MALKVFIRSQAIGSQADHELKIYNHIATVSSTSRHPGQHLVRNLLDSFKVTGPDGDHHCLVHTPLWDSVKSVLTQQPTGRLSPSVLGLVLHRLLLALDFLHSQCHLVHTDLKYDNIMFGIEDDSVFEDFEKAELETPCPRKEVDNGRTIYRSRQLRVPDITGLRDPVLCDFGSAVFGNKVNATDVQPDLYRAPEIILEMPWSYEIDIWNVGCMVREIKCFSPASFPLFSILFTFSFPSIPSLTT